MVGTAFSFGILCVLLTGVVEQLGGVLQASFMIFGVVGGPLLGVFTLGVLFRRVNQTGALAGLLAGLCIGIWVGTGAIVSGVQPEKLPLLNDGCTMSRNATALLLNSTSLVTEHPVLDNSTSVIPGKPYVFPLYELSYQWYCALGWLVVVVVANLVCLLTGSKEDVDPECLSPVIRCSPGKCRSHTWSLARDRLSSITSSQVPFFTTPI